MFAIPTILVLPPDVVLTTPPDSDLAAAIHGTTEGSDCLIWQTTILEYLATHHQHPNPEHTHWLNTELAGFGVELVRNVVAQAAYTSAAQTEFWILLAAQSLNHSAQNALLKVLEEPAANSNWIMATTNLSALLPTIQSRCQIQYWPTTRQLIKVLAPQDSLVIKAATPQHTHGYLVSLVGQIKDRTQALAQVDRELQRLTDPTIPLSEKRFLKPTLECWQHLQQNANLGLSLEQWLFAIKALVTQTTPTH